MLLPVNDVLLGALEADLHRGKESLYLLPDGDHDEVAEARLLLAHSGCRSVTQERRRHAVVLL